jgi:hypothetical protein
MNADKNCKHLAEKRISGACPHSRVLVSEHGENVPCCCSAGRPGVSLSIAPTWVSTPLSSING